VSIPYPIKLGETECIIWVGGWDDLHANFRHVYEE